MQTQMLHVNGPLPVDILFFPMDKWNTSDDFTNCSWQWIHVVEECVRNSNIWESLLWLKFILFWNEHNYSHRRTFSKTWIIKHPELDPLLPRAGCKPIIQPILTLKTAWEWKYLGREGDVHQLHPSIHQFYHIFLTWVAHCFINLQFLFSRFVTKAAFFMNETACSHDTNRGFGTHELFIHLLILRASRETKSASIHPVDWIFCHFCSFCFIQTLCCFQNKYLMMKQGMEQQVEFAQYKRYGVTFLLAPYSTTPHVQM